MGMIFEKVPLRMLLDSLMTLYNAGAEFVDVLDGPSISSDSPTLESINNIGFVVKMPYLHKDVKSEQEFLDNLDEGRHYLEQMNSGEQPDDDEEDDEQDGIYKRNYYEDEEFKIDTPDIDDIINDSI